MGREDRNIQAVDENSHNDTDTNTFLNVMFTRPS